jgi:hypothetical protein
MFAAVCWWTVQSFELYLRIVKRQKTAPGPASPQLRRRWTIYHSVCWGAPLISVILLLLSQELGYSAPDMWCFLRPGPVYVKYAYVYGPIGLMLLAGLLMMFRSV